MGDHGDWGDFELWGDVVFDVAPFDNGGKTLVDFVFCFLSQGGMSAWLFGTDVGAALDSCHDVIDGPGWSAIGGASSGGVALEQWDGRVCCGTKWSLGIHKFARTYGGFDW